MGWHKRRQRMIVCGVCILVCTIEPRRFDRRIVVGAAFFMFVCLVGGQWRLKQVESSFKQVPSIKVAGLQVDPTYVESVSKLQICSQQLDGNVDLVVWPETSLGHYAESLTHFRDPIRVSELSESPNPLKTHPEDSPIHSCWRGGESLSRRGSE